MDTGRLKNYFKVIFALFFITCCVAIPLVWTSDTFQKKYFPEKYWQEQIDGCRELIENIDMLIQDIKLEMVKTTLTTPIELRQLKNYGIDTKPIRDLMRDEIKSSRELIEYLRKERADTIKELQKARQELNSFK